MKTATALAIRHVAFEDLGSFAPVLRQRGFIVGYREAGLDDLEARDLMDADLVIVLGGPVGVYETAHYPFLKHELRLIAHRIKSNRPVLGICLGAQLMARTLGARVYKGRRKELSWGALSLSKEGRASPLAALARTEVLHWHGDTFDLPDGATLLASNENYANQAFAFGDTALALQFHVEVTAGGFEHWLIGHAVEIADARGVDVAMLRRQARRKAPRLEQRGPRVLSDWLDHVGL
ncbi:MAG TPA: glutamine amidotransferase [Stellaceae bacterium]|nr:glutamine amidotransferase [Stellaceae bacterium]